MNNKQYWTDSEWFHTWETLCRETATDAAEHPEPEPMQLEAEPGEVVCA